MRVSPEDFEVEELPAYLPSGEGTHLYLWVEKRGRNTRDVVREIARALSLPERELGVAGQKDRHAVTRQFISVPGKKPEAASALEGEGWKVLSARLHTNKLRTGHLSGNRFQIRIRGCVEDAAALARTTADALQLRGLPNAFGPQRFGHGGSNVGLGRALLANERSPEAQRAGRDRFMRRLLISAFQAHLFNQVLAARLTEGLFASAVPGDLMKRLESGGLFVSEDPALDGPRVAAFEISPTGPMFGHRMMAPRAAALGREEAILEAEGLTLSSFERLGADGEGTRRALRLPVKIDVAPTEDGVQLAFDLPKGSFATVVLRELMKGDAAPEIPEE